ncbi:MAG: hypothetical protein GXO43_02175 [Crenarchaeota archaeon]|nr:hypothetical protein [Thermoproteota archaeon]
MVKSIIDIVDNSNMIPFYDRNYYDSGTHKFSIVLTIQNKSSSTGYFKASVTKGDLYFDSGLTSKSYNIGSIGSGSSKQVTLTLYFNMPDNNETISYDIEIDMYADSSYSELKSSATISKKIIVSDLTDFPFVQEVYMKSNGSLSNDSGISITGFSPDNDVVLPDADTGYSMISKCYKYVGGTCLSCSISGKISVSSDFENYGEKYILLYYGVGGLQSWYVTINGNKYNVSPWSILCYDANKVDEIDISGKSSACCNGCHIGVWMRIGKIVLVGRNSAGSESGNNG